MKSNSKARLSGLRVLVPRPSPQGDELVAGIQDLGGDACHFPVIEIHPPDSYTSLDECLSKLGDFALLVVVSASAAAAIIQRLDQNGKIIPVDVMVAAIGPKTSRCLRQNGIGVDFETSSRIDTEGLVEVLDGFDLDQRSVCIFRGQDGRGDLKAALESRGGNVEYATCYGRRLTSRSFASTLQRWYSGGFDAVIITSVSILEALDQLLGKNNRDLLKTTPVVTISERLQQQCLKLGIDTVIIGDATTEGMICVLAALVKE